MSSRARFWLVLAVTALSGIGCSKRSPSQSLAPPEPSVALRGFAPDRPITATLETDAGSIRCELDAKRTPRAVSLFVGFATGRAAWRDPKSGRIRADPLYRDLRFHRAIAAVMVQSGSPTGDSTGQPGFRIAVEATQDDGARLREPGALALARYTPPPNRVDPDPPPPGMVLGSQFFITLTDMSHLAGKVSVLGRCVPLERITELARRTADSSIKPRLIKVTVGGI